MPISIDFTSLSVATYEYNSAGGFVTSQVYLDGTLPAAVVLNYSQPDPDWQLIVLELPAALLTANNSLLYGVAAVVYCPDGSRGEVDFVSFGSNDEGFPRIAVDGPVAGGWGWWVGPGWWVGSGAPEPLGPAGACKVPVARQAGSRESPGKMRAYVVT